MFEKQHLKKTFIRLKIRFIRATRRGIPVTLDPAYKRGQLIGSHQTQFFIHLQNFKVHLHSINLNK
jgi:hypothetical protein